MSILQQTLIVAQIMFRFATSKFSSVRRIGARNFGAHHGGSHEPHVPEGYRLVGQGLLYTMYFWIFYQFKENGAQLFGFYKPWEHPHEHSHHSFKFVQGNIGEAPTFTEDEEEEDDHGHGHGHHH